MSDKLQGAYVEAWVWVSAEEFTDDPYPFTKGLTKNTIEDAAYNAAKELYGPDIKFAPNTKVLLSYG